jgi:SAM-dependent methyltransferase
MSERRRPGYSGSGPGEFTPDGCAVEIWRRLPVGDEPRIIAAAVPPPARLLELGCGAGRMTRPLVEAGFVVTAVDESAAMLAEIDGATTVLSPIEELALPQTFDVVLLGSFLVHGPSRAALLATCRRHVAPGGTVLIQREGAGWHENLPRRSGVATIVSSADGGDGFREVHVTYDYPDGSWSHTFRSEPLTAEQFEQAVREAGLSVDRYLTADGTWAAAVPVG